MFPQRSPTVPSPYIITLALGGWRERSIFLYGNCRRNRSTESLPELPIPKLTAVVWPFSVYGILNFDHKFTQHSALSTSDHVRTNLGLFWYEDSPPFDFSEHFPLPLHSLLNGLYLNLSLLIRTQQHYPTTTRSRAMQDNPAEPAR